jgi:hypothetical protein
VLLLLLLLLLLNPSLNGMDTTCSELTFFVHAAAPGCTRST